jgi:hypothetical protein
LLEGNAGIFVTRRILKLKERYELELDPNATYREYVFIRLPENTPLEPIFSSDDVLELSEITLKDVDGVFIWKGTSRSSTTKADAKSKVAQPGLPQPDPPQPGSPGRFSPEPSKFIKILKLLWNGNTSLTS